MVRGDPSASHRTDKVCTPRHVAYDVDSGLPHLGCHSGYIFGFRSRRLHHTRGITGFCFVLRFEV